MAYIFLICANKDAGLMVELAAYPVSAKKKRHEPQYSF